jgi:hypothetical protein
MTNNDPIRITNAGPSLKDDQSGRARRYFISMMIRTACFILTVVLPSPYRWIALTGALLLPYVAVIVANAGRETIQKRTIFFDEGTKALPHNKSNGKSD